MSDAYRFTRATTDPGEASDFLRAADGAFDFAAEPGSDFSMRVEQFGDEAISVGDYAIDGRFTTNGAFDGYCVSTVTGGSMVWEDADDRGDATGRTMLARPDRGLRFHCSDLRVTNVYLSDAALRDAASVLYGLDDAPLAFDSAELIHPRYAAHWRMLVSMTDEAVTTGAYEHELVRAGLLRNLAIATLESFRLHGDPDERRLSAAEQERRYRLAVRFIDDFASLPITVLDIAAAVHCTVPQLERAFAAHAMSSPRDQLRRVRLAAAHADLVRGGPAHGPSVDAIAHRWGFVDAREFRRRYRETYGRSSAATLWR